MRPSNGSAQFFDVTAITIRPYRPTVMVGAGFRSVWRVRPNTATHFEKESFGSSDHFSSSMSIAGPIDEHR